MTRRQYKKCGFVDGPHAERPKEVIVDKSSADDEIVEDLAQVKEIRKDLQEQEQAEKQPTQPAGQAAGGQAPQQAQPGQTEQPAPPGGNGQQAQNGQQSGPAPVKPKAPRKPGELPGKKPSPQEQNLRPILEVSSITKNFDGFVAVDDVDLTIYEGEIFALLGSSGCGKSTLLRMIAGFETPTSGSIMLEGEELIGVPPYKRPLNMMFQSYALFPYMTVWQNIAFGLRQEKMPRAKIKERVESMLSLVHMEDYADRKPFQLSGGQKQRVALARSLAKEPKLLLLDEPMGALDKQLREQMRLELVGIINSVGVTCLMVTHDQEEAMTMADRIAIMDRGEFIQVGAPRDIYENPNCRFCAQFIGNINVFDCTLLSKTNNESFLKANDFENRIRLSHGVDQAEGMSLTVAIRPEKIFISHERPEGDTNICKGIVDNIAYLGDISIYYVKLPQGRTVCATLPNVVRANQDLPSWEESVYLSWDPESCIALTI